MLIHDSITCFLRDQEARGNSPKTVLDYVVKLWIFEDFCQSNGRITLGEIDFNFLQDYVIELRSSDLTSVSVQSYVRSLRAFLRWSYDSGYSSVDFCSRFRLPKAKRDVIDILTDTEIARLFSAFPNEANQLHLRNRVIISLMLDCGLRLNEVVSLKVLDLHLSERLLIINGKGQRQRYVTFGNSTFSSLLKYIALVKPDDYLFVKYDDMGSREPITEFTVKQMFRKLKNSADIPRLYPHLLRHTFATRYLENGGDIYTLQNLLGHSSLDMVKKYLHLSQQRSFNLYRSPLDNVKKPPPIDEGYKKDWCSCGNSNPGHLD